jgi:diguanylate cyclase (GGDEF)-like protein
VESSRPGDTPPSAARGLTLRVLSSTIASVAGFGVAAGALNVLGVDSPGNLVGAALATIVVGTLSFRRAIAPMVATQADLQVRYEAALADALRDPLTGLGNHRAFHEELDRQVAASERYAVPLSLLLIDLDDFKAVNDQRGHAGGDRVLRTFGQLLNVAVRRADRAFRVGGDEFAVLLPHTDLAGARIVANRLLSQSLQPTLRISDFEPISFSGGMSAVPEFAASPAQLYSQADAALYVAKRQGRTAIAIFTPSMEVQDPAAGTSSATVADVIANGRLRPVYQPIVSLGSGQILGVEGLIRPLSPAPFRDPVSLFAAAEASGRLTALDLACVEAIVAGASRLPDDQFLSVNLSPPTFEAPEFNAAALLGILARHGFPSDRLVVELTERQQLNDPERVRTRMEQCRRAGIRFAADDIGAGNAGLRLLAEVRFDILKVDLSLVQRSRSEGQSSAVIGSVVELATRTGALVVAEGVEDAHQVDQLLGLGITAAQGYHLGRPGSLEADAPDDEPAVVGVAAWRQEIGLSTTR